MIRLGLGVLLVAVGLGVGVLVSLTSCPSTSVRADEWAEQVPGFVYRDIVRMLNARRAMVVSYDLTQEQAWDAILSTVDAWTQRYPDVGGAVGRRSILMLGPLDPHSILMLEPFRSHDPR